MPDVFWLVVFVCWLVEWGWQVFVCWGVCFIFGCWLLGDWVVAGVCLSMAVAGIVLCGIVMFLFLVVNGGFAFPRKGGAVAPD